MVFWAIDFPINLIVRSVATTINGKLKAAQVILKLYISIGIETKTLDSVIILICTITSVNNKLFFFDIN